MALGLLGQKVPQVVGHVFARRVAFRGPLRQGFQTNTVQFLRHALVVLARRAGLKARHLLHQFRLRLSTKRRAAHQQLVEHDAQTEDVAATIDAMPFATCLLGTHVSGSSGALRSLADVLFSECQPKINDVRLAVVANQNVAGFHIPMDQSLLVGVVQGIRHGRDQFGSFPVLEPMLLDLRGEIGSLDVFGNDVAGTVLCAADIMHRDDAGMIEIGDRASFGEIRLCIFRLRDQLGVRNLDGNGPVQLLILGQIDKAEAAFAEHLLDAVATDPLGMFGRRTFMLLDGISLMVLRHIVRI